MGNLTNWFMPEKTSKAVWEGVYPVVITAAKLLQKEKETDDNKTVMRDVVELTFKTLSKVKFPDNTEDNIIISQQYYFDVQMHQNALNGLARAFGIEKMDDTSDFEGKVGIIGITNRDYQANDGTQKTVPQFGWGLFSYAPMSDKFQIEYIANTIQGKPTDDQYKEWFKEKLAQYRQPK